VPLAPDGRRARSVSSHGHAGRAPDVGGDDELRNTRLGDRSNGVPRAAAQAGFDGFAPDACLVNRYEPAVFLFGGLHRAETPRRVPLADGVNLTFRTAG
jgi:hypothetical protein